VAPGVKGQCPQCGAPLSFGGAHSLAAVCSYCRSSIARKGANLETLGKVPDLVATDSRLALMSSGKLGGKAFTLIGHVQLAHPGGGTWDEWYASFTDGTWGWLAEAQGRLYLTRPLRGGAPAPRLAAIWAGKTFPLSGVGSVTVDEVNEASFASAEGELPFAPRTGAVYRYADCSGEGMAVVTLDYGEEGDEAQVFAGREITYAAAGLTARAAPPAAGKEKGAALACPSCGGPLSLKLAESESCTCPSCHSLVDVTKGTARLLAALKARGKPAIPLGSKGTLRGEALEVIGWVLRSVKVDSVTYTWSEYLLHGAGGYRWLSESAGHFVFLTPISGGKVKEVVEGYSAFCDGRHFKHFQSAAARYEQIQGEFYWKLDVESSVNTHDFVAPPYLLSCERDAREVNWTRGVYVPADEVWKSLGLSGAPPAQRGVGACQPNPHGEKLGRVLVVSGLALAAMMVIAFAAGARPRELVAQVNVPLASAPVSGLTPVTLPGAPAPAEAPVSSVVLSDPFQLAGGPQAVEIEAAANVSQAWVGMDVALINDDTGEADQVGMELSYYSGVEDGESWSEGSNVGKEVIGGVSSGRYVLRVEPQIEKGLGTIGSEATVRVYRGVFLVPPLLIAMLLLGAWPLLLAFLSSSFERRRWEESDHAPSSSGSDGDGGALEMVSSFMDDD
jgi:hypothetical protein